MTPSNEPARALRRLDAFPLGWILTVAALGYALAVHHGVGPVPPGGASTWFQPTGWLLDLLAATTLGAWLDTPTRGLGAFTMPALALAAAVFATTRSALARTLAVAAALATALFLFYGLGGNRSAIWTFFGWRGSAVMTLFALVMAAALCAPWLGASWLRRGWPLRIALYLPLLAGVVVALRDVTGTNPKLAFAISPWPVVTMFGIEIGASLVVALVAIAALVLSLVAATRLSPGRRLLALALALGTLVALAVLLRPQPGLALACVALVLGVLAAAVATRLTGPATGSRVAAAARACAAGAVLAALPIGVGLAWVNRDYVVTREGAAKQINEALKHYFEREEGYPDTLEELVAAKDLPAVPHPQVGFGVDGEASFTYQNFGTSYILEFSAPRWVQCAYNPPWGDEELEDEAETEDARDGAPPAVAEGDDADGVPGEDVASNDGAGDDAASDAMPGSWSCPRKPPELW